MKKYDKKELADLGMIPVVHKSRYDDINEHINKTGRKLASLANSYETESSNQVLDALASIVATYPDREMFYKTLNNAMDLSPNIVPALDRSAKEVFGINRPTFYALAERTLEERVETLRNERTSKKARSNKKMSFVQKVGYVLAAALTGAMIGGAAAGSVAAEHSHGTADKIVYDEPMKTRSADENVTDVFDYEPLYSGNLNERMLKIDGDNIAVLSEPNPQSSTPDGELSVFNLTTKEKQNVDSGINLGEPFDFDDGKLVYIKQQSADYIPRIGVYDVAQKEQRWINLTPHAYIADLKTNNGKIAYMLYDNLDQLNSTYKTLSFVLSDVYGKTEVVKKFSGKYSGDGNRLVATDGKFLFYMFDDKINEAEPNHSYGVGGTGMPTNCYNLHVSDGKIFFYGSVDAKNATFKTWKPYLWTYNKNVQCISMTDTPISDNPSNNINNMAMSKKYLMWEEKDPDSSFNNVMAKNLTTGKVFTITKYDPDSAFPSISTDNERLAWSKLDKSDQTSSAFIGKMVADHKPTLDDVLNGTVEEGKQWLKEFTISDVDNDKIIDIKSEQNHFYAEKIDDYRFRVTLNGEWKPGVVTDNILIKDNEHLDTYWAYPIKVNVTKNATTDDDTVPIGEENNETVPPHNHTDDDTEPPTGEEIVPPNNNTGNQTTNGTGKPDKDDDLLGIPSSVYYPAAAVATAAGITGASIAGYVRGKKKNVKKL